MNFANVYISIQLGHSFDDDEEQVLSLPAGKKQVKPVTTTDEDWQGDDYVEEELEQTAGLSYTTKFQEVSIRAVDKDKDVALSQDIPSAPTPLPYSEVETEYGFHGQDDPCDTADNCYGNDLDKEWQRSMVVRTRIGLHGPDSTCHDGRHFILNKGLDTVTADNYCLLLHDLKRIVTRSNCLTLQVSDIPQVHAMYEDMKQIKLQEGCLSFMMTHFLQGKRQSCVVSKLLELNCSNMQAITSGCKRDNLFTALSTLTVGDASNCVVIRTEMAIYLLHHRTLCLGTYSIEEYSESILECLSPNGVLNPCILSAAANVLETQILCFAYSYYVADLHDYLTKLRGRYVPRSTGEVEQVIVFVTPLQGSVKKYNVYPAFSKVAYKKTLQAILATNNERKNAHMPPMTLFSDLVTPCLTEDEIENPFNTLTAQVALYEEAKKIPFLCPDNNGIIPPQVLSDDEEDVEKPLGPVGMNPKEFFSSPPHELEEKGCFPGATEEHGWLGFIKAKEYLEAFVEGGHSPDYYPIFPCCDDAFVVDKEDMGQNRHGAFPGAKTRPEFHDPEGYINL